VANIRALVSRAKAALTSDPIQAALDRAQALCDDDVEQAAANATAARQAIVGLEAKADGLRGQHRRLLERVQQVTTDSPLPALEERRRAAQQSFAAAVAADDAQAEAAAAATLKTAERETTAARLAQAHEDEQRAALQATADSKAEELAAVLAEMVAQQRAIVAAECAAAAAEWDRALNAFAAAATRVQQTFVEHGRPMQMQGVRLEFFGSHRSFFAGRGIGPDGPNRTMFDLALARQIAAAFEGTQKAA
jgi:hypothetical protein